LFAIISNSITNIIYDSRIESSYAVNINLANLINNPSQPISIGTQSILSLIQNVDTKNIVNYSNLYSVYLTNYCLEINPNDLIKISTWLNNEWNTYLRTSVNIVVINTEKYFDQKYIF
jgi:hypothetical protein